MQVTPRNRAGPVMSDDSGIRQKRKTGDAVEVKPTKAVCQGEKNKGMWKRTGGASRRRVLVGV